MKYYSLVERKMTDYKRKKISQKNTFENGLYATNAYNPFSKVS